MSGTPTITPARPRHALIMTPDNGVSTDGRRNRRSDVAPGPVLIDTPLVSRRSLPGPENSRPVGENGYMTNKWTRIIMIAVGAMIVLALLIRVFFSKALQDLLLN